MILKHVTRSSVALATTAVILAAGSAAAPVEAAPAPSSAPSSAPALTKAPAGRPWIPKGAIVTDGYVTDVVRSGDDLVVRGGFHRIGRYNGPGFALDATTGAQHDFPVLDGEISVSIPDGAGGWYVGGYFDRADASRRSNLLHVLADGSLDPVFDVRVTGIGGVYALALDPDTDTLYLAGTFSRVGNVRRDSVAAVSTVDGSVLPFKYPNAPQAVPEMVFAPATVDLDARLYIGTAKPIALDPVTGQKIAGFSADVPARRKVEMAVDGDTLYVGGNGIVALDGADGSVIPAFDAGGLGPSPQSDTRPDDTVSTLLVADDRLYVGGDFSDINGASGPLAAFDLTTGAPDAGFAPDIAGLGNPDNLRGVFDVTRTADALWVAGKFTEAGGQPARNVVQLDAATGARNDVTTPDVDGPAYAVDTSGDQVLVGGRFTMTDALLTTNTAVLNGETLDPIAGGDTSPDYSDTLLSDGKVVYAYSPYGSWVTATDAGGHARPALSHKLEGLIAADARDGKLVTIQRDGKRYGRVISHTVRVFSSATGKQLDRFSLPLLGYVTDARLEAGNLTVSGSFKRTRPNGQKANTAMLRIRLATHKGLMFDPHLDGPVQWMTPAGSPLVVTGLFQGSAPGSPKRYSPHRGIALLKGSSGTPAKSFQGVERFGNETEPIPVDDHTLYLKRTYTVAGRYVGFRTGAAVADPTGGYGRFAQTFEQVPGGTAFVAYAGYYDHQFISLIS